MTTLSAQTLAQIRRIQLHAGHLVTDALAGNYLSAFKGRGMEFDSVREYMRGDDVRTIDWNVTARMNEPFVKVLREERELTLMLMVDVSPSQGFGTAGRLKREVAAELAAILAFLAIRNSDKVGLQVFSDHVEQFIPPKKGRAHVWNIIRTVLTHEGSGRTTDIKSAVEGVQEVLKRRSLCFLISDFWAEGYERSLALGARRHELIGVLVEDPRESEMVDAGVVAFRDAETGELVYLDTSDRRVRESYREAAARRREELRRTFRRLGLDSFVVRVGEPVAAPLMAYLREREKRRVR